MTSQNDSDKFANFDLLLKRRGRGRWKWSLRAAGGQAVMSGSEFTRIIAVSPGGARSSYYSSNDCYYVYRGHRRYLI